MPIAVFNMSKFAGVDTAKYDIQLTGKEFPDYFSTQVVEILDESDLSKYENKKSNIYAKMKIVGTNAWMVWSVT